MNSTKPNNIIEKKFLEFSKMVKKAKKITPKVYSIRKKEELLIKEIKKIIKDRNLNIIISDGAPIVFDSLNIIKEKTDKTSIENAKMDNQLNQAYILREAEKLNLLKKISQYIEYSQKISTYKIKYNMIIIYAIDWFLNELQEIDKNASVTFQVSYEKIEFLIQSKIGDSHLRLIFKKK